MAVWTTASYLFSNPAIFSSAIPSSAAALFSYDYGICLAQKFIEEKTNEIPAAQELLRLMDLRDMIVTADAMNCQKDTVSAIVTGKGDYVLALKGNQQLFHEEVRSYFEEGVL